MEPRRILVTGAAGFVGGHLLPALRATFPAATIIPTALGARPGFAPLDVTDAAAVAALLADSRPDACIHLAAIAAIPAARRDPDLAWQVNLHGTLNIARAVLRAVPQCTFLAVASADMYGASFRSGRPLDETAPLAPLNAYGATKAAADIAIGALAAEGLRAIRLRPFNHTGAGQSAEFVVAAFARQAARIATGLQEPVMRVGALAPVRDFLDVRDVCAAYVACLQKRDELAPGTVLNIASGTPRRIGDILDLLLARAGISPRIETEAALLRPSDIPAAIGDAAQACALLHWSPRIAWERTLDDVLGDWMGRVRHEA